MFETIQTDYLEYIIVACIGLGMGALLGWLVTKLRLKPMIMARDSQLDAASEKIQGQMDENQALKTTAAALQSELETLRNDLLETTRQNAVATGKLDHLTAVETILQEVVGAARRAAGRDDVVLSPGSGGSLPLYLFTDVLKKPILMVPIANHDDLQHAPDENLRIWNLWYGIDFYAQLFTMPEG